MDQIMLVNERLLSNLRKTIHDAIPDDHNTLLKKRVINVIMADLADDIESVIKDGEEIMSMRGYIGALWKEIDLDVIKPVYLNNLEYWVDKIHHLEIDLQMLWFERNYICIIIE